MGLVLLKLDNPGLVDVCGRPPFFWKKGEVGRIVVWMGERKDWEEKREESYNQDVKGINNLVNLKKENYRVRMTLHVCSIFCSGKSK